MHGRGDMAMSGMMPQSSEVGTVIGTGIAEDTSAQISARAPCLQPNLLRPHLQLVSLSFVGWFSIFDFLNGGLSAKPEYAT